MKLDDFARAVLFGTTLEEKLASFTDVLETNPLKPAIEIPELPNRPEKLSHFGSAPFPSIAELNVDSARGRILHFFANHELLAMELMALVLLRFPDAPTTFRLGLAKTILEEQNHMRLYIERMRELGVEFGDLPVSDYFWNCMKATRSPLEFVTQMSLTFEQANLDYSRYYRDQVARVGDEKTAAILERVYQEEIGHVKHGLIWFNAWRENSEQESDWDAYRRLLPPPLNPRRAKGEGFCIEARQQAGFSETFIQELQMHAGSRGRPPVLWRYNPSCDAEIARGKPGFTPSKPVQELLKDLEHLPMFLARDADVVQVSERPPIEWLKKLERLGFRIPEFVSNPKEIRDPKLGGFEPWGWSPEVFEAFRPLRSRLVDAKNGIAAWDKDLLARESFSETGLSKIFSKAWSVDFLRDWIGKHPECEPFFGGLENVGHSFSDEVQARARIESLLASGQSVVLKAPWGTSGNQIKRVLRRENLDSTTGVWLTHTLANQGSIIVEPLLTKHCDLSIQLEVGDDAIRLIGIRRFLTDTNWQYQGTVLGRKLSSLSPGILRFLNTPASDEKSVLAVWQKLAEDLGTALRDAGYRGPAGIDALVWNVSEDPTAFRLKPVVEVNPRWTMGRVAIELEEHIVPGVDATWIFIPVRLIDRDSFVAEMERKHVIQTTTESGDRSTRIESGVLFTNSPQSAHAVLTALVVGAAALKDFKL